ncbi:Endo-1,4-beta-xylanase A precursor [compost metagenome]
MVAMLVRLLDLKGNGQSLFRDVPADKWYAESISAAVQAWSIQGVDETSFAPDAPIKRQEAAAMIIRAYMAAGGQLNSAAGKVPFSDIVDSPVWVQDAVGAAYANGLIQGQSQHSFNPEGAATRAESAQILYNIMSKLLMGR